jgi:heat shock protein HtpX
MWELIKANQRKSQILFVMMGLCLITLGYLIGSAYFGAAEGGLIGILLATILWLALSLVSYFAGSSIILSVSNAKEVTPEVHSQLFNVVEEMKIAAGLSKMPKVYIINAEAPNAFATGNSPENCAIAVTAGLLAKLNRDELQGVVAHEVSHITNRDIRFVTFAGVMIGAIVLISDLFLRGFFYSGGSSKRYNNKSSGGGQAQLIIFVFAILFAILAPILARLLYFAISRKREYLADASATRLTRYPEGLASALEKISQSSEELPTANKVTAPMYIINPLKRKGMKISDLTSTHPPISERIRILRSMAGNYNYQDYQKAYSNVKRTTAKIIPDSELAKVITHVPVASAITRSTPISAKAHQRNLGDIMMAVNNYSFIKCDCGLKMKIPPGFAKKEVICPKCGKMNHVISS